MTTSPSRRRAARLLPATAAVLLAGCAAVAPTPAAVGGLQPPATVQNATGATIPYAGTQGWAQATVLSGGSRDLAVLAFGTARDGGGTCGPQLLRVLARESRSAVHVLVAAYEVPTDPAVQCGPLSGIPTAHVVRLRRPLDGRAVIDTATGRSVPVLVGTTVPSLATDLGGWRQQPLERDPQRDVVTRTWTTGAGRAAATLRLVLGPEDVLAQGGASSGGNGPVLASGSLNGSPASVRGSTGRRGYDAHLRVAWRPSAGRSAVLEVRGTAPLPWTPERLLEAARSLRP